MSHLDTAFKIGAAQAQHDFQAELDKAAQDFEPPAGRVRPGQPPAPGPAPAPRPAPPPPQKLPTPSPGLGPRQPSRPIM